MDQIIELVMAIFLKIEIIISNDNLNAGRCIVKNYSLSNFKYSAAS